MAASAPLQSSAMAFMALKTSMDASASDPSRTARGLRDEGLPLATQGVVVLALPLAGDLGGRPPHSMCEPIQRLWLTGYLEYD
jgi:hypothetical protein